MRFYELKTQQDLKKIWELAGKEKKFKLPIVNPENPLNITVVYNKLLNYRRHVRNYRLNPLYIEEWNAINNISMRQPRFGEKYIYFSQKLSTRKKAKLNYEYNLHPLKRFNVPTGVSYGAN